MIIFILGRAWVMDIEAIQTSPTHACIREISIMPMFQATFQASNIHAIPCQDYNILEEKFQKGLIHCFNHVHHLPYYPKTKPITKTCIIYRKRSIQAVGHCLRVLNESL